MCSGRSMNFDPSISARRRTRGPQVDGDERDQQHRDRHGDHQPDGRAHREPPPRPIGEAPAAPPTPLLHDGQHRPRVHRLPLGHRHRRDAAGARRRAARSPSSWLRRRPAPAGRPPASPGGHQHAHHLAGHRRDDPLRTAGGIAGVRRAGVRPPAGAYLPRRHSRPLTWTSTSPAPRPGTTTARTLRTGRRRSAPAHQQRQRRCRRCAAACTRRGGAVDA